jgi:hypothetical protein
MENSFSPKTLKDRIPRWEKKNWFYHESKLDKTNIVVGKLLDKGL